jgi:hypothetical protein
MDGTGVDMTATGVDLTGWPSRVSPDSPEWEDYASRVAGQRSVRTHRRPDR